MAWPTLEKGAYNDPAACWVTVLQQYCSSTEVPLKVTYNTTSSLTAILLNMHLSPETILLVYSSIV